jgi:hypothetical protein
MAKFLVIPIIFFKSRLNNIYFAAIKIINPNPAIRQKKIPMGNKKTVGRD